MPSQNKEVHYTVFSTGSECYDTKNIQNCEYLYRVLSDFVRLDSKLSIDDMDKYFAQLQELNKKFEK